MQGYSCCWVGTIVRWDAVNVGSYSSFPLLPAKVLPFRGAADAAYNQ